MDIWIYPDDKRNSHVSRYGSEDDPFELIDVSTDDESIVLNIQEAIRDAASSMQILAEVINSCPSKVTMCLSSVGPTAHDSMNAKNLVALMASYLTSNVEYGFRTWYETYDCVFHVFWSMLESMEETPFWWSAIREHFGEISFVRNEDTLELRTCVLALNLCGLYGVYFDPDDEAKGVRLDGYGKLFVDASSDDEDSLIQLAKEMSEKSWFSKTRTSRCSDKELVNLAMTIVDAELSVSVHTDEEFTSRIAVPEKVGAKELLCLLRRVTGYGHDTRPKTAYQNVLARLEDSEHAVRDTSHGGRGTWVIETIPSLKNDFGVWWADYLFTVDGDAVVEPFDMTTDDVDDDIEQDCDRRRDRHTKGNTREVRREKQIEKLLDGDAIESIVNDIRFSDMSLSEIAKVHNTLPWVPSVIFRLAVDGEYDFASDMNTYVAGNPRGAENLVRWRDGVYMGSALTADGVYRELEFHGGHGDARKSWIAWRRKTNSTISGKSKFIGGAISDYRKILSSILLMGQDGDAT